MEIVIKIPEEIMEYIKNNGCLSVFYIDEVAKAIKNGTPLPKGHGRLINADVLMEYCQNNINKTVDCNDIARFPTIIKADKNEQIK